MAGVTALLAGAAGITQNRAKKQPYNIQIDDVSGGYTVDAKVRDEENNSTGVREYFDFTLRTANGGEVVVKHARISSTKNGMRVQLLR